MGVRFGPGTDRTDNAMKTSAQTAQMNQEAALFDYVARLQKHKSGRRAVHIRLSNLRPYNRRDHHLRIATSSFDRLVDDFEGGIFRLFNDDLVVICNGATIADMDEVILHLRYLFSDDPLLKNDEEGRKPFCDWFDLENDYPKLYKRAEWLVKERETPRCPGGGGGLIGPDHRRRAAAERAARSGKPGRHRSGDRAGRPVDHDPPAANLRHDSGPQARGGL